MKKLLLITAILISTLLHAQVEARLPFSNMDYNSMSLRPLNLQETDFAVRFYINIGSSLDRIITLRADSIKRDVNNPDSVTSVQLSGVIQQIGRLFYETKDSTTLYYNEIEMDYTRVDSVLKMVQDFDLAKYQSRTTMSVMSNQPNSLYTIELKKRDYYHTFYFYTLYPTKKSEDSVYGELQAQIFHIFPDMLNQIRKTSHKK